MGIKICPKCGGKVSTSRDLCIHCGYVYPTTKVCPDCGEILDINVIECPGCGFLFKSDDSNKNGDDLSVGIENPAQDNKDEEKYDEDKNDNVVEIASENTKTCPFCGETDTTQIGIGAYMCSKCRNKFLDTDDVINEEEIITEIESEDIDENPQEQFQGNETVSNENIDVDSKLEKEVINDETNSRFDNMVLSLSSKITNKVINIDRKLAKRIGVKRIKALDKSKRKKIKKTTDKAPVNKKALIISLVCVFVITASIIGTVVIPYTLYNKAINIIGSDPNKAIKYFEYNYWEESTIQVHFAKASHYFRMGSISSGLYEQCIQGYGKVNVYIWDQQNGRFDWYHTYTSYSPSFKIEAPEPEDGVTFVGWLVSGIYYNSPDNDVCSLYIKAKYIVKWS